VSLPWLSNVRDFFYSPTDYVTFKIIIKFWYNDNFKNHVNFKSIKIWFLTSITIPYMVICITLKHGTIEHNHYIIIMEKTTDHDFEILLMKHRCMLLDLQDRSLRFSQNLEYSWLFAVYCTKYYWYIDYGKLIIFQNVNQKHAYMVNFKVSVNN
jgi:hypothetical protein